MPRFMADDGKINALIGRPAKEFKHAGIHGGLSHPCPIHVALHFSPDIFLPGGA